MWTNSREFVIIAKKRGRNCKKEISEDKVMVKSWTSHEQSINKSKTSHEQIVNKMWTSHEQIKFWKLSKGEWILE